MDTTLRKSEFSEHFLWSASRSIGCVFAALLLGLTYVIVFPLVALGMMVWLALRQPDAATGPVPTQIDLAAGHKSTGDCGWFHLHNRAVINTSRLVGLGSITVAAGFFTSVLVTIYGGFPLWFV